MTATTGAAASGSLGIVGVGHPTADCVSLTTPEALQRFMQAEFPLSEQQFAAATAPLGPAVVVAGAGSGKTTLMAARVVWLVGTGQVRPEQVLGLTFTTKAAGELAARIRTSLRAAGLLPATGRDDEEEVLEPTVSTYNAYAASLLSEHGLRIGHEPDTRVVTDAGRHQLGARAVAHHGREVRHLSDHPPTVIANLLQLDGQMSEHLVEPHQVRELHRRTREAAEAELERSKAKSTLRKLLDAIERREELLHLVEDYRRLKKALGLMEFSDQIELGARLARSRSEVGQAERARFRVVLLDEYQDTSVAQAQLLSALFSGPTPAEGLGHPVMAVGDPNQAIYGWRGASISNLLGFGRSFPGAAGGAVPRYALTTNRRSDRNLLELANVLAEPLARRGQSVLRLEPPAGAPPGTVRAELHETYVDELAALPSEVRTAHDRCGSWKEIGVLTRDNATAADAFAVLSEAEIPVEIVGLKGLLALPEVAEVVAVLTLLDDLTANAALLLLLSGPRWAVGPRDLALLGRRATELSGVRGGRRADPGQPLDEALAAAVAGADPVEVASLADALDDPGEQDYSSEALERFALLSEELGRLRQHTSEPLLDLVRRIIDTTGIDIELASSTTPAARARRDNLDLFVKAVADFQAVDGDVSLTALVSYLEAEDEAGNGMDVATPTGADTVKLLTVHRSKGLEWDVVFLLGVAQHKFPTSRGRVKWTSGPAVLPNPLRGDAEDLPRLREVTAAGLRAFEEETREHEAAEELRLAYVGFTRARHELTVSSYVWSPTRKDPCGPSLYQQTARDFLERLCASGEVEGPLPTWPAVPAMGEATNPLQATPRTAPWPTAAHTPEVERRELAAQAVRREMTALTAHAARGPEHTSALDLGGVQDPDLDPVSAERVAGWDRDLDRLLVEARARLADEVVIALPSSLSATTVAALEDDPDGVAASLARPMPRRPSPEARFGTRFHAWVEAHYGRRQELLVDPEELGGRADLGVTGDEELAELVERFLAGPLSDRRDVVVEAPFALVLAGQVVRGRIDAVFPEEDGGWLVVDWKTNRSQTADPRQLAVYRLAWAELTDTPLERVRAAFYYVRDGELVLHDELPDRADLQRIVAPGARPSGP